MGEPALHIIGREHELEVLLAAVDAAAEAASALVVCGEPGIGKSVLIEAAARRGQVTDGRLACAPPRLARDFLVG